MYTCMSMDICMNEALDLIGAQFRFFKQFFEMKFMLTVSVRNKKKIKKKMRTN